MVEIKISVIVPIYNIEKYLEKCIKSIICQTYSNLEIILVDDGSTDTSGQICDRYADKDQRIVIIHKQNGGLVSARKAGLNIATGEYIAFVDGDDWIDSKMYEDMLNIALNEKADFVESGYYDENEQTKICTERSLEKNDFNVSSEIINQIICQWMNDSIDCIVRSTIWSKIYKTDLIKHTYSNVPDDMSRGEDYINFANLLFFVNSKICITSNTYYHYRNRDNSLSHDNSFSYYVINQDLYAYMKRLINEKFPQLNAIASKWRLAAAQNGFRGILYTMNNSQEKILYKINDIKKLFNKRVILYGAGNVGREYYLQIVKYEQCQLIAWVDKNYAKYDYEYYNVKPVSYISTVDYDKIVIAVLREKLACSIKKELLENNIPEEKIIWLEPHDIHKDL